VLIFSIFAPLMLKVKKSQIPGAGKGLFTTHAIPKGEVVCEYEGERITWKECLKRNEDQIGKGAYYFYINARNCVDAQYTLWAHGRYANDAAGLTRVIGLKNNAEYEVRKNVPYIVATRNIKPGEEIFVSYGKDYWDAMKDN
jgi:SET domain-containing protein